MVASLSTTNSLPPGAAVTPDGQRIDWGPVRFTVDDALRLMRQGKIPEDASIELLNGLLVYKDRFDLDPEGLAVPGAKHDYVVHRLARKLVAADDDVTRTVRTQSTLICATNYAPIPDAMILRGSSATYRDRQLPTAADALCVIEVADSSYERDTGEKLAAYARAGVPQYVVINLRNRTAELYATPDVEAGTYPPPTIVDERGTVALRIGEAETFDFAIADILP